MGQKAQLKIDWCCLQVVDAPLMAIYLFIQLTKSIIVQYCNHHRVVYCSLFCVWAGADELNSLIVLILSLQPEQTTRENLPVVRKDLKVLTSRALFFFQESLQTLDVVQVIDHHSRRVYIIS